MNLNYLLQEKKKLDLDNLLRGGFYNPLSFSKRLEQVKDERVIENERMNAIIKILSFGDILKFLESKQFNNYAEKVIYVRGYNREKEIGNSEISFKGWNSEKKELIAKGYIETNEPGFSRNLLSITFDELEKYSKLNNLTIFHYASFMEGSSERSAKIKLPKIYTDSGYTLSKEPLKGKFLRIYKP